MKHDNVEFKVIEDKRIVIATIRGISNDPIEVFNKKFMAHATSDMFMDAWHNQKFMMPNSMKAVARCIPDDEFSVEKGKQIALKKLSEKYNNSMDRHIKHMSVAFHKCLDKMDEYLKEHKMI
jgi:hypothetical protein